MSPRASAFSKIFSWLVKRDKGTYKSVIDKKRKKEKKTQGNFKYVTHQKTVS